MATFQHLRAFVKSILTPCIVAALLAAHPAAQAADRGMPSAREQKQFLNRNLIAPVGKEIKETVVDWVDRVKVLPDKLEQKQQELSGPVFIQLFLDMQRATANLAPDSDLNILLGSTPIFGGDEPFLTAHAPGSWPVAGLEPGSFQELIAGMGLTEQQTARAQQLFDEYAADLAAVNGDVQGGADVDRIRQQFAALVSKYRDREEQSRSRMQELNAQIPPLEAQVAEKNSQIATLDSQIAALSSQLAQLEAADPRDEAAIASVNAQLSARNSERSQRVAERDALNAQIQQIRGEVETIQKVDLALFSKFLSQLAALDQFVLGGGSLVNLNLDGLIGHIQQQADASREVQRALQQAQNAMRQLERLGRNALGSLGAGFRDFLSRFSSFTNGFLRNTSGFISGLISNIRSVLTSSILNVANILKGIVSSALRSFLEAIHVPDFILDVLFAHSPASGYHTARAANIGVVYNSKLCKGRKNSPKRKKCEGKVRKEWQKVKSTLVKSRKQLLPQLQSELAALSAEMNNGLSIPEEIARAEQEIAQMRIQ